MTVENIVCAPERIVLKENDGRETTLAVADITACKMTGTTEAGIEGFYCDFQRKDGSVFTAVCEQAAYDQLKRELQSTCRLPVTLLEAPASRESGRGSAKPSWLLYTLIIALLLVKFVRLFVSNHHM